MHRAIESDLIRRDQLDSEKSYSVEAREVLAELNAPGYDYRTVAGLDEALYLNKTQVEKALEELEQDSEPPVVRRGQQPEMLGAEGPSCLAGWNATIRSAASLASGDRLAGAREPRSSALPA